MNLSYHPRASSLARLAAAGMAWLFLALAGGQVRAGVRIKDITEIEGARSNQLMGMGMVFGLQGTGGKSVFTRQVAVDLMKKLNVNLNVTSNRFTEFNSNNVSVVIVTAELSAFAREGSRLDVMVSAFDDAASLQGGTLLLTPLLGADGEAYAVAQGPVSIGGFTFSGAAASAQKNHPTVGRIPGGAIVEREALGEILFHDRIRVLLREPDFHSARSIAKVINGRFPGAASSVDAGTVEVRVPQTAAVDVTDLVSEVGLLEIRPDVPARVVINEKTGTVVVGEQVKIAKVDIAHGNLRVVTAEEPQVSQPAPFSGGETTVVPRSTVEVHEEGGHLQVLEESVTVADLAQALNALGVTPRDLVAIFQALKQAGALHAELIIM